MKKIFLEYSKTLGILLLGTLFITSCVKEDKPAEASSNPQVNPLEIEEGSPGTVVTVTGSGLGGIKSVIFDNNNVPASFNPVFNNENAILFRVPDTAYGGPQNIVLINTLGKEIKVPFSVIALPTISAAFPTDFVEGTEVTFTGNNLETVDAVTIVGSTGNATVVSKTRKQLVVRMPATTQNKVQLNIHNTSGDRVTPMDFVNLANAYPIFTESLALDNWSWGGTYTPSTETLVTGANSLKAEMTGNAWGALSLHSNAGVPLADYSEIAFWIKGADTEITFALMLNWQASIDVVVPANKWTYFKFPLQRWKSAGVNTLSDLIYQVKGDGKLVYFENIVLLK